MPRTAVRRRLGHGDHDMDHGSPAQINASRKKHNKRRHPNHAVGGAADRADGSEASGDDDHADDGAGFAMDDWWCEDCLRPFFDNVRARSLSAIDVPQFTLRTHRGEAPQTSVSCPGMQIARLRVRRLAEADAEIEPSEPPRPLNAASLALLASL